MPTLNPGDLVTFPLRGGKYGVAHVVHVDDLAINDLYHFVICDAVIDGADGGFNAFGEPAPREHDPAELEAARPLVEHIGLTRGGIDASGLSVVGFREVEESALDGYRSWLHARYEDAVRRGVMRDRVDDNPEDAEDFDDEEVADEELEGEEIEGEDVDNAGDGDEMSDHEDGPTEDAADAGEDGEGSGEETVVATATTLGVYDNALGDVLVRLRSVFEREAYSESELARHIIGMGSDSGAIDAIIARLLDGDFAAGYELLDYGEAGMRALGERLDGDISPELADDILHVLVNSGESVAYERVARFMSEHGGDRSDPLYGSAVRAYCYAVMLTGAEPEPLKERLTMLESVTDAEFADDIRSAREALAGEG